MHIYAEHTHHTLDVGSHVTHINAMQTERNFDNYPQQRNAISHIVTVSPHGIAGLIFPQQHNTAATPVSKAIHTQATKRTDGSKDSTISFIAETDMT